MAGVLLKKEPAFPLLGGIKPDTGRQSSRGPVRLGAPRLKEDRKERAKSDGECNE